MFRTRKELEQTCDELAVCRQDMCLLQLQESDRKHRLKTVENEWGNCRHRIEHLSGRSLDPLSIADLRQLQSQLLCSISCINDEIVYLCRFPNVFHYLYEEFPRSMCCLYGTFFVAPAGNTVALPSSLHLQDLYRAMAIGIRISK